MKITIDGNPVETDRGDLAALLVSLDHDPSRVATALNGRFVPREARADTPLHDDDAVEIVVPIAGG